MTRQVFAGLLLAATVCIAASARAQADKAPVTAISFETVSIRPSSGAGRAGIQILPDGYEADGWGLQQTVLMAFVPGPFFQHLDELKGLPQWASSEKYDIRGKVAATDVERWRDLHESYMKTPPVLQAALRQMLAERCKLRVHSEAKKMDGYQLRVRSRSPMLVESAEAPADAGMPLRDGARATRVMQDGQQTITFYNTSMEILAEYLNLSAKGPISDGTGLSGRYTFVLHSLPKMAAPEGDDLPVEYAVPWNLKELGLDAAKIKVDRTVWVVDSIERPSLN